MGEPTTQRIPWWPLPVLMAASFLVFWSVLALTPFSDDHSAVWNAGVRGIPWRNGFFRPLADLSFRLGDALAGTSAMGHRSFNVALHGLNAFLLFTLWFRTGIKLDLHERLVGAIIAGVLFLLYPFHLESIVWLVGREASLGTCFVLLGLWVAGSSLAIPYRMLGLGLSLLLGCLCYESALLLLPLALFIAWRGAVFNWPTNPRQVLLALLTAALVFTLLRSTVVPPGEDSYLMGFFDDGLTGIVLHAPKAAARLFLPPGADPRLQLTKGVVLLIGGAVVALLVRSRLTRTVEAKNQLFMWTGLLAISFVIPTVAGVSTTTSEGDRFLYMPSAFLCGLVASVLIGIRQRIVRYLLLSLVVLASAIGLQRAQANWKEASRITQRILDALPPTPSNGRLFVGGLPDSYQGAFIFRNGSPEAVDLIGGRGSRMVVVNDDQLAKPGPIHFRGQNYEPTRHSIQCRINAEDPFNDFRPSPGKITSYHSPGGHGVRVDTHVYAGYTIPPNYDSMIGKLIVSAQTREEAITKMERALSEYVIEGVNTTIPFHLQLMQNEQFRAGNFTTKFLEDFEIKKPG